MPISARAPSGLGPAGRRIYRELIDKYDFEPGERRIVEDIARTTDFLARIDAELLGKPLLVAGSTGQDRAHPLLTEHRAHRALIGQLLRQLRLPVDDAPASMSASDSGRRAARSRWGGNR